MKGRSNWITEDIHDAGNGRGSSLLEEPLLVLRHRTRTWNGTRRSQQPFRVQSSATELSPIRKKTANTQISLHLFFKRVDRGGGKNSQKSIQKKILMTWITTMV